MKTQFNIDKVIERGQIKSELELERALIANRKLKLLSKDNPELKKVRKQLRDLIEEYENSNWSSQAEIGEAKLRESDIAELIAEKERRFLDRRKEKIKEKLKALNINQQQLGIILGHNSKSYISELMNGISPFSLKDLIIIHRLLKIELSDLIPTILSQSDRLKIESSIAKLDNPNLKLSQDDLELV